MLGEIFRESGLFGLSFVLLLMLFMVPKLVRLVLARKGISFGVSELVGIVFWAVVKAWALSAVLMIVFVIGVALWLEQARSF